MESKNYYDILEVSVKASAQEITLAKNKLAKRYHPDVNMRNGIDTTDKMQEILEAYLVLSDPVKRAEYDREIRGNRPSKMQTFNLYEESEEVEDPDHPTFKWYQNRNYNLAYLLKLYDEHEKNDMNKIEKLKLQNRAYRYQHSVKKLLRY